MKAVLCLVTFKLWKSSRQKGISITIQLRQFNFLFVLSIDSSVPVILVALCAKPCEPPTSCPCDVRHVNRSLIKPQMGCCSHPSISAIPDVLPHKWSRYNFCRWKLKNWLHWRGLWMLMSHRATNVHTKAHAVHFYTGVSTSFYGFKEHLPYTHLIKVESLFHRSQASSLPVLFLSLYILIKITHDPCDDM